MGQDQGRNLQMIAVDTNILVSSFPDLACENPLV